MTFSMVGRVPFVFLTLALGMLAGPAAADPDGVAFGSPRCHGLAWRQLVFESNALLLAPALAGVLAADGPDHARWKGGILFDRDVRDAYGSRSKKTRDDATEASNILLGVTVALPAVDLLFRLKDSDCDATTNLASDFIESFLLVSVLEEGTKLLSARKRPRSDGGIRSFFSGHASLTGTAAGLVCANAFRHGMWGERWFTKALPCAVTTALASAAGAQRLKADEHWASDVLVGLLVGFATGYFDLPNAAALLHAPLGVAWLKEHTGVDEAQVLPTVGGGAIGLRLALRY